MLGFYETPDKFLEEAAAAEWQQISAHLLTYCECKLNTKKEETKLVPVVREKGSSSLFPHDIQILHCKNKKGKFQMAPSSNLKLFFLSFPFPKYTAFSHSSL